MKMCHKEINMSGGCSEDVAIVDVRWMRQMGGTRTWVLNGGCLDN